MYYVLPIGCLIGAGVLLLCLAYQFAMRETQYVIYTSRDFTDFTGDVARWLRSETE